MPNLNLFKITCKMPDVILVPPDPPTAIIGWPVALSTAIVGATKNVSVYTDYTNSPIDETIRFSG